MPKKAKVLSNKEIFWKEIRALEKELEKTKNMRLNNRIFDNNEAKTKTTSIVTNGNAVNGNVKAEDDGEYKFTLPPDEEGIVYQCHLCSYTATTRCNFNAHVNTHYDFQCVKCDFEDKVGIFFSVIYFNKKSLILPFCL